MDGPERAPLARRLAGVIVLFALPLILRLAPLDHGLPRLYVPDAHVVRCALGMAQDKDLAPQQGTYSSYPYLVPYLLLPVYAAEYAAGRIAGEWRGAEEFALQAKLDPGIVHLPARAVVALSGALTAWAVFRAARAAGLRQGAWVAAWLSATGLLGVHLSTHERPWAVVVFFGALALWACLEHARSGALRPLLLAGAAAGLAFAAHQAGLVFLGLCGLAWLLRPAPWRAADLRGRLFGGLACVLLFLAVGLLAGHAYYLRHGFVPAEAVVGGGQAARHFSVGGQAVNLGFSLDSARRLSLALWGYDPLLVLLGLAGLPALLAARSTRAAGLFLAAVAVFFLFSPSDHVRYLLPVCMLLCLPAGLAAERLARTRAGLAALAVFLAVPLVQAVRFDLVLARQDARAEAERALAALPEGSLVAIDHYGPAVDLSQRALERLQELRGSLRAREAARLELLKAGALPKEQGVDAIHVEELFEVDPATGDYGVRADLRNLGSTPEEVLRGLGVTHLLAVSRRGGRSEREALALLAGRGELVARISPGRGGAAPRESFLPTEMDFPLTGLWQVQRPGPYMELRRLP